VPREIRVLAPLSPQESVLQIRNPKSRCPAPVP